MMHTIPHLVRTCAFPFSERTLVVDTAPLTGDKVGRPGIGSMDDLRDRCRQLLQDGVVDRVIDMDYSDAYRRRMYQKHLGNPLIRPTHNYKGYPILGTIYSIEAVSGDYVLHFDSDMLLHQQPGYCWIDEAIAILERRPTIMMIRPMAGPPLQPGTILQNTAIYDPDGFFTFRTFGSRVYLIHRERFDTLLPLPVMWRPFKREWMDRLPTAAQTMMSYVTGIGKLDSWEKMVTQALQRRQDWVRVNMDNPKAWTLHPKDRGDRFIRALPDIIRMIEAGEYPPEQAGKYDMILDPWLQTLNLESG